MKMKSHIVIPHSAVTRYLMIFHFFVKILHREYFDSCEQISTTKFVSLLLLLGDVMNSHQADVKVLHKCCLELALSQPLSPLHLLVKAYNVLFVFHARHTWLPGAVRQLLTMLERDHYPQ